MAGEISVISDSGRTVELLFYFPSISSPRTVNGVNVIDRDPSAIPAVGGRSLLTDDERNAVLAGTASYEMLTFTIDPEASVPELVAQVQTLYDQHLTDFQAAYAHRWRFAGARVSAT